MSRRLREILLGYAFLVPSMLIFAVFVFYPFARNFQLPFYKYTGGVSGFANVQQKKTWVGFDQWRDILGGDEFRGTLWNTVKFTLLTVPTGIALGLLLAVVAHQRLRGITVYRTIFSSTVATSVAVASTIFFSLTNSQVGFWHWKVGGTPILEDPTWALPAIALVAVWQSLGLSFIVMSAGLQGVPDDLLEAAAVDGAGPVRRFFRVTLPMLSPTVFFATVVGCITAFRTFAEIDLLTPRGGTKPIGAAAGATQTVTWTIYDATQRTSEPAKAGAFAVALFLILLVLTMLQLWLGEKRVSYDR